MLERSLSTEIDSAPGPKAGEHPEIEIEEEDGAYARVGIGPLLPGFGMTLGNSLRRVLLSSLQGAAIVSVRVDGIMHEFSTMPHIKEDTIEFLLNVKELRLRALSDRPGTLILDVAGREGEVTGADIQAPEHYEVVNPELHLATIDSAEGKLFVEFNADRGRGYVPAGQADGLPIGVIPMDAIFTPVRKVNYRVDHARVGQSTNFDRLILEVWTDGSMSGVEAVSRSADILIEQLKLFSGLGKPALPMVQRGLGAGVMLTPDLYETPIDELGLSMRAYNSLRRSGLMVVGQIMEKSEDELLNLRNFGRKSYDELLEKLQQMGLVAHPSDEHEEALPLEEEPLILGLPEEEAVQVKGRKRRATSETAETAETAVEETGGEGTEELDEWQRRLLTLGLEDQEEAK